MARKQNKELKHAYIFSDGHALLVYKIDMPETRLGHVEIVEVVEGFCHSRFKGRIVIHEPGMLAALKGATSVRASEPKVENGSPNSKEKNIPFGYLSFNNSFGYGSFHDIPGLIGDGYSYQPEESWEEAFDKREEGGIWNEMRITKIHRLKKKD
jgi:hypothetical protein